jgi:hypothetical protein
LLRATLALSICIGELIYCVHLWKKLCTLIKCWQKYLIIGMRDWFENHAAGTPAPFAEILWGLWSTKRPPAWNRVLDATEAFTQHVRSISVANSIPAVCASCAKCRRYCCKTESHRS